MHNILVLPKEIIFIARRLIVYVGVEPTLSEPPRLPIKNKQKGLKQIRKELGSHIREERQCGLLANTTAGIAPAKQAGIVPAQLLKFVAQQLIIHKEMKINYEPVRTGKSQCRN